MSEVMIEWIAHMTPPALDYKSASQPALRQTQHVSSYNGRMMELDCTSSIASRWTAPHAMSTMTHARGQLDKQFGSCYKWMPRVLRESSIDMLKTTAPFKGGVDLNPIPLL